MHKSFLLFFVLFFAPIVSSAQQDTPPDSTVRDLFDRQPQMVGGLEALRKALVYPKEAIEAGIEGDVFIRAILDRKGNVIDTEVLRKLGYGCDEAAAKAVKTVRFTNLHPGDKDISVVIPVRFKIIPRETGNKQ